MAFHSHGRLGEAVPAGGCNGRDGLSEPSGEWVVNDETMEEFWKIIPWPSILTDGSERPSLPEAAMAGTVAPRRPANG
jgi:hypothetical protein